MKDMENVLSVAECIVADLARATSIEGIEWELRERSDGPFLAVRLWKPHARHYSALQEVKSKYTDSVLYDRITITTRKIGKNRLAQPETKALLRVLSESLTVDVHSIRKGFIDRYIESLSGHEAQITAKANHVVYGRRGSGKSSLLGYGLHHIREAGNPHVWIAMQTYARRSDTDVIVDVLIEVLEGLSKWSDIMFAERELVRRLESIREGGEAVERDILRLLPKIRKHIGNIVERAGGLYLFIDDLHVVSQSLQPKLLGALYSIARGNRTFLKVSAIENFTKLWDPSSNSGLEVPHDAQLLKLDYNLTMPDKAKLHIEGILDAHARHCGIPGISRLCNRGVIDRLVWVSAGVPRDALNLFSQAVVTSANKGHGKVGKISLNIASSVNLTKKIEEMDEDASSTAPSSKELLEQVRAFCIEDKRKNAFLVEIKGDAVWEGIRKLTDLRLLHVLHEGITPREAGNKFAALMLDYGFYVGIRTALSVDLFQQEPQAPSYADLRILPKFRGS